MDEIEKKVKEVKELLSIVTPKPSIVGRDNVHQQFFISRNNKINKGGQYYHNFKAAQFIHFTTLQGLENILRSKKLRLFDLQSMDDQEEFKVTAEFLEKELQSETLKEIKSNLFCLSMCERVVEDEETSLSMWRSYGDNGNGVGLVLSFDYQGYQTWERYMLSKVFYDTASYENLRTVIDKYTEFERTSNWKIRDFYKNLYRYFAFHKRKIYSDEKEVRLLYNDELTVNGKDQRNVYCGLKRNGGTCRFIELELEFEWSKDDLIFFKKQGLAKVPSVVPYIKIEEIIFGYRINKTIAYDISEVLHTLIDNLKNKPKIKDSVLRRYFEQ